jgi:hypothetical protein
LFQGESFADIDKNKLSFRLSIVAYDYFNSKLKGNSPKLINPKLKIKYEIVMLASTTPPLRADLCQLLAGQKRA